MTEALTTVGGHTRPARTRRIQRAGSLIAAAVVALVVWTISVPILRIDLVAGSGSSAQTVGPIAVAVVPLVAGALAWGLLALLEKAGAVGRRIWQIFAWVVLAVSLTGPLTLATSVAGLITLLAMHLLVGTALIIGLSSPAKNA